MVKIDKIQPHRSARLIGFAVSAILVCPALSFAQTSGTAKCQVPPQQQSQNGQTAGGQSAPNSNGLSQSLSGNLADCNGVLKPPATGDKGLVAPAPQTGNMPVIKPGQAPNQQGG